MISVALLLFPGLGLALLGCKTVAELSPISFFLSLSRLYTSLSGWIRFYTSAARLHSFIPAISIAPFQVLYYSEALPTTARDTVSEFHAEAHRQLQGKDLPKVPKWRL